jgi:hypothetical protein
MGGFDYCWVFQESKRIMQHGRGELTAIERGARFRVWVDIQPRNAGDCPQPGNRKSRQGTRLYHIETRQL